MNPLEDAVAVGDKTPPVKEQARLRGWRFEIFNFGKAEQHGFEYFNPGLVRRSDGLWLLVRLSELVDGMLYGRNKIWACKLADDLTPQGGPILIFPESAEAEQFEDPRAVYWNEQTWVGCANFTWFADGSWTGAHQCLGVFQNDGLNGQNGEDARWNALVRRDPPVGTNLDKAGDTNGRHNKNWLWFFHEGKLHLIYMSDPWHVIEFGSSWDEQTEHKLEGVKWKFGIVRGGTPPVLVGDLYYTFFHSSLPWRGRFRRYYMGAIAFESQPPFKPVMWTHEPLLIGSQNDPWQQQKPLVVFPCGAICENDFWTITMGINDLKCAWVRIPHEDVVKALKSAPVMPAVSLLAAKTEKPVYEHIPFQPNGGEQRGENQEKNERQRQETATANAPVLTKPPPSVPPATAVPAGDRVYRPEILPPEVRRQFRQPVTSRLPPPPELVESAPKIDLRPLEDESTEDWEKRLEAQLPAGTPPIEEIIAQPRRKYKKRRKKKALKSKA